MLVIPAGKQGGSDFAAVGSLQETDSGFRAGGADDCPSRAGCNSGKLPALIGIGINQHQRTENFLAHED